GVGIFLVEVVAEVNSNLSSPKKSMRRWKRGNRTRAASFGDDDPAGCFEGDFIVVLDCAKTVVLPVVGDIPPDYACAVTRRQSLEAGFVFVSDPRRSRLGENFLFDEIGAFEEGVRQTPAENSGIDSRERHLKTDATAFDLARAGVKGCFGVLDLIRVS